MDKKCDKCQIGEIENDRCWWCDGFFPFANNDNQGERAEIPAPLYFPNSDYSNTDKKSYEMRQIHPMGKNSTKYRWFICTPNFPSEQYKVKDPHCHIWTRDGKGKVRISLFATDKEKVKIKGKVKDTDLTEIEELVGNNKAFIYEEWKKEWIR